MDPELQGGAAPAAQQGASADAGPRNPEMQAAQVGGESARGVEFNPSNESASGVTAEQGANTQGASGVSGLGGQAAGGGGDPSSEWESLLDAARGLGYDPGQQQFGDDRQFLLHLLNQSQRNQQADYYSQLGRQIAPHVQGFNTYLQQQQGQQAQPQTRPEWEPPEFNEQWLSLVQRDPQTGVFLAKPGVNPALADKVNEYDAWDRKFGRNPVAAIRPYVEQSLPALVQQRVQQQIAAFRQQQEVDSIVQRNAEWMYQSTQDGRPVIGVGGRPVPTPEGMRYSQLVGELEAGGMRQPAMIDRMARQLLMGEMHARQIQGQQGQVPVQQQQNALASSRSQRNPLQSLPAQQRQQTPGATDPEQQGMSLTDMLRGALDAAGYTDNDFRNPEFLTR